MSNFAVLDADKDSTEWGELIRALPEPLRDLHYLPGYARAYADKDGGKALCAAFRGRDGAIVLQPFMATAADEIRNVYGYGGPLWSASRPLDCWEFAGEFRAWQVASGVKRERCRLHPFYAAMQLKLVRAEVEKEIVAIDLTGNGLDEAAMRHGHRDSLRRARALGVKVEQTGDVAMFLEMYCATMARHGADPGWDLTSKFLTSLNLAGFGAAVLVATVDGEPEAACVLLHAFQTVYYAYAGSFGRHPKAGAGTLLVVEAARLARAWGYRCLHLGGGTTVSQDDPLLAFKAGFSSLKMPVYRYEREVVGK